MKRVTILAPRSSAGSLVEWLQKLGIVHVEDAVERLGEDADLKRPALPTVEVDNRIRQLEAIEQTFDAHSPRKRSLAENFVTLPARVSQSELQHVADTLQVVPLADECASLAGQIQEHDRAAAAAEAEIESLEFFRTLPFTPEQLRTLRETTAWVGKLDLRAWERLLRDDEAHRLLALQELTREKRTVCICAVALSAERDQAARLLRRYELAEMRLPDFEGSLPERLGELQADVKRRREERKTLVGRVQALARARRDVGIALGHWHAVRARVQAQNGMANSSRVSMLCGYIRARDVRKFNEALAREFPGASTTYADPTPQDKVPVSLRHGPLGKPMRFLVDMFGLPDYFSFDPTPYLSLSFLVFFGMCFSDAVYGLMLCALAGYLAYKARGYENLRNMCVMFLYCGISTIIFGALSGSWASDLWRPQYLGANNPLLWIKEHTAVVDPLEKAVVLLVVCLAIGLANQLYGIALKAYGLLRRGKTFDAFADAGLWLLVIPGLVLVVSPLFFPTPRWAFRLGAALMLVGGIGLVLTQGRHEKGFVAKAITGLVSLYGIVGSYGCLAFIGDLLSYTRLLALGLTTSIVGMSFNIIAGILKDVPDVGIILFVLMIVFGHAFNFCVSILGSFVHPARLIFLEFFGRFYEGGAVRFRPLSLSTDRLIVEQQTA